MAGTCLTVSSSDNRCRVPKITGLVPVTSGKHLMGGDQPPRPSLRDVARAANVSMATASRALNGLKGMSDQTRSRVLEAAAQLGFRPNEIARSLKVRASRTIGLVTDDLEGVFTMLIARGLEDVATVAGFNVFLCNSYGNPDRERQHIQALLDKQVDGIVLSSGYRVRHRGAPAAATGRTPLVYLYQYTSEVPVFCLLPDDTGGGSIAIRHLLEVGRQRIGIVAGPPHYEASGLRLQGARNALQEAGLSLAPSRVRWGRKWYEDVGYQLVGELMSVRWAPDGIFCMSDSLATGALGALKDRGLSVPGDVSVVGFDNRYGSAHVRPPLTTVALPLYELGASAGELLLGLIQGEVRPPAEPVVQRLPCTLVERESSRRHESDGAGTTQERFRVRDQSGPGPARSRRAPADPTG
jgi:LacI family transcriptional regulator